MPSSSSCIPRIAASGELRAAATQRGQVKMQEVRPLYGVDGVWRGGYSSSVDQRR